MTIGLIIERADELRPNPFSLDEKIRWLSELDSKIAKDILKKSDFKGYDPLGDEIETKELLLDDNNSDIYLFYLCSMIDFFSRDYAEYNNSITMFNSVYDRFAKEKHRENYKNKTGTESNQYYKNIL